MYFRTNGMILIPDLCAVIAAYIGDGFFDPCDGDDNEFNNEQYRSLVDPPHRKYPVGDYFRDLAKSAAVVYKKHCNFGRTLCYKNGVLHSMFDKPAVSSFGRYEWWCEGKRHRDNDKPAIAFKSADTSHKEWWFAGKLHRDGSPAIEHIGVEESYLNTDFTLNVWYRHGVIHKNDSPAIIMTFKNNPQRFYHEWVSNGRRHRSDDQPAIESFHPLYSGQTSAKEWWVNGQRHRTGGAPAVITDDSKEWWVKGRLHREGSPAIDRNLHASKMTEHKWYRNGKLHRADGPAVVCRYKDSQQLVKCEWWMNGRLHREGAPAVIEYKIDGMPSQLLWYVNGIQHCDGGIPAFFGRHGDMKFYVNGLMYDWKFIRKLPWGA